MRLKLFYKLVFMIGLVGLSIYILTCSKKENNSPYDPENPTPPAEVTSFHAQAGDQLVDLFWIKDKVEIDVQGYIIYQKSSEVLLTLAKNSGKSIRDSKESFNKTSADNKLTLNDPAEKPTDHDILSKTSDTTGYVRLALVGSDQISYRDHSVQNNRVYEYLIVVIDKGDHISQSYMSNQVIPNKIPVILATNLEKIEFPEAESLLINLAVSVDDDEDKSNLKWSFTGFSKIQCTIQNGSVTIKADTTCWNGEEKGQFVVQDSQNASDTLDVAIKVTAINQTPSLSIPTHITFTEDESYEIDLTQCIHDCETPLSGMTIQSSCTPTMLDVSYQDNNRILKIKSKLASSNCQKNWSGRALLKLQVTDGGETGSDQKSVESSITVDVSSLNHPPVVPYSPEPVSGATEIALSPTLKWQSSDPDCDNLIYKVFLGKSQTSMSQLNTNTLSDKMYLLSQTLDVNTTYYWYIESNDGKTSTQSPIWSFTTLNCQITLSKNVLAFSSSTKTNNFSISNSGGISTTWSIQKENCSWLTLNQITGTIAPNQNSSVIASVNCTNMNPGTYNGRLLIQACNNEARDTIEVNFEVIPVLSISEGNLKFDCSNTAKTLTISNTGCGILNFQISKVNTCSWLSLNPSSGSINTDQSSTISITASETGLSIGSYSCQLKVESQGLNTQYISIEFKIEGKPVLNKNIVSFNCSSTTGDFTISNSGCGALNYSITGIPAWLELSKITGSVVKSVSEKITATIKSNTLACGTLSDTLNIVASDQTLPLIVNYSKTAAITLSKSSIILNESSNDLNDTIRITNSGCCSIPFSIAESGQFLKSTLPPWLQISPNSGSIPANSYLNIILTGQCGQATCQDYQQTFSIIGEGITNESFQVNLTCGSDPVMRVSSNSLNLGSEVQTSTFVIFNDGKCPLSFILSKTDAWISSISPSSGTVDGESSKTITITINRGLFTGCNQSYTGTISSATNAGNSTIQITAQHSGNSPSLSTSTNAILFATLTESKTVTLSNSGDCPLSWTASKNSWITISASSGNITGKGSQTLTVTLIAEQMSCGSNTGSITLASNGGTNTITVNATKSTPLLAVSPSTLDFGSAINSLVFSITNPGCGTLSWSISEAISWLSINGSSSGTTTSETDVISVIANRDDMVCGSNSGTITITGNGGTKTITVNATKDTPVLYASVSTLDFGSATNSQTFSITNQGCGTLTWSISEAISWLSVNPTSGTTTTETDAITVTVDRTAMTCGSNNGTIAITSDGGTKTITVSAQKNDPILNVSANTLSLTTAAPTQSFAITNPGCGTLSWTITEAISWLTVSSTSGTTTSETDQITATANGTGLTAGTYTGIVTVTGNGTTHTIDVTFDVTSIPPPSGTWLTWDDGSYEGFYSTVPSTYYILELFHRPASWTNFKIKKIRINFYRTSGTSDRIHLCAWNTQYVSSLSADGPYQEVYSSGTTDAELLDPVTGWNEWNVDWTLSIDKFCIGYFQAYNDYPDIYADMTSSDLKSWRIWSDNGSDFFRSLFTNADFAIQVYVEPVTSMSASAPAPRGRWLNASPLSNQSERIESNNQKNKVKKPEDQKIPEMKLNFMKYQMNK